MRNLILSVKRSQFRSDDPKSHEADENYKLLKPEILKNGDYECEFCAFRSVKFQHIHHLDDNHQNNQKSNLVIACPLCHMCNHIGFSGERQLGTLIYLDKDLELKQSDFNNLVRFLWIGSESKNPEIKTYSENMLDRLYNMTTHARRLLKSNDLTLFGDFLMGLSHADYQKRAEKLNGFYFLPYKSAFKSELENWLRNVNITDPKNWIEIAKQKEHIIFE
jgi:intracellular multiplication protein IcmJ